MWYWSANRDESVFPNGSEFDIHRSNVKDQVGYGSGGPHFCLGANLARREIQVMFDEILRELPDLEVVAEPTATHVELPQRHQTDALLGLGKRARHPATPTTRRLDAERDDSPPIQPPQLPMIWTFRRTPGEFHDDGSVVGVSPRLSPSELIS